MIAEGGEGGAVHHLGDLGQPRIVGKQRGAAQVAAQDLVVGDALDEPRLEREALHALGEPRLAFGGVLRPDQDQEIAPARAIEQRGRDRATEKAGGTGQQ